MIRINYSKTIILFICRDGYGDTMQLFLEFERRSGKFDENRDGTGRPNNGRHRAL